MKALFVNPGGIGDQILLLPTVKLFKDYFQDCSIDLITEPRSTCIREITNLYRNVKEFDFKGNNLKILKLRELLRDKNYKYLFISGASYKANLTALLSSAEIKIGFHKSILSNLFLTHSIKLNTKQYFANSLAELITPIIPDTKNLIKTHDLIPEIKISSSSIEWIKKSIMPRIKDRYYSKKIFIHPGVSKLSIKKNILKTWNEKNWATLIEKLIENQDNTVILLGGKDDEETIKKIHSKITFFTRPKNFFDFSNENFSLEKLAALISTADLFICVDSAPMHIAVGLGKKIVAFFGPTDPKKLLPNDQRFTAVHATELSCRPCLFDIRKESCSKPICLDIPAEQMLNAIKKQLELSTVLEE